MSTWKTLFFFWSQNRFYCQQILMPRITPGVWGLKEEGMERGRNDMLASRCCCCCEVASVVSDAVRPDRWQPTRLPRPWGSPGKNTGVGCHFLLQCMKVKMESELASREGYNWRSEVLFSPETTKTGWVAWWGGWRLVSTLSSILFLPLNCPCTTSHPCQKIAQVSRIFEKAHDWYLKWGLRVPLSAFVFPGSQNEWERSYRWEC